ncbi:glycosyltransferase [Flavobacterium columnare]|nr:glycosyltransferase [Flavobacterium columnare]
MNKKKVTFIIPSYNEVKNCKPMTIALHNVMKSLEYEYEFIFIDDGSNDETYVTLIELSQKDQKVKYVSFSRNFGKDNALRAGIDFVNSDCVITLDADLQHPPDLVPLLLHEWEKGNDVVYAFRENENPHTSFFSKLFSKLFWKTLNYFSSLELENGISDFRLLDRKVVDALKNMNESEIFFRGMIKWVGFQQKAVPYIPNERMYGETTYSRRALLKLALQGITSFSTRPLYLAVFLGIFITLLSFIGYLFYILFSFYHGHAISGWASLISTVVFFGGLNLIVLGIIGIYVGKLFMQSKGRPNYLIRDTNYKK